MGTESKYHRYREAGEEVNVVNAEKFGAPVRSLFSSSKLFSMHRKSTIVDDKEQVVYQTTCKAFSFHDHTEVQDANGNLVATIRKKMFSFHERHFVKMADGYEFQISNELWHVYKDITNIEGLGWKLRGNMFALNFELYDQNEEVIATICQKMMSLHDKYSIDVYKPEYEAKVVAVFVTLQHMIKDREARNSSSSSND